ncbi:MAG: PKD domain-containing protein, partial [Microthrixaceae bacterium]
TNTGPAPITRYEWSLTNAQGQIYKNFTASGQTVTLPDPGITDIGVYTITLTVYDLSDPTVFTQTTRVISINNRPRAVITQVTPTGGVITPDNGQPSITLNGGANGTDPGSFDPDTNGSITNYAWEFWTSTTTTRPTQACSVSVAPPCIIDGGTTPTVTFGPAQTNVIPYGTYRVKLVVKDDNNAPNNCAGSSPYNSTCIDNPSTTTQRWWTDVKINRIPQASVALPQRCSNSVTLPFTAPCTSAGTIAIDTTGSPNRAVFRRDWTLFSAVGASGTGSPTDTDGSISTYQWTFTRVGGGAAPTETATGTNLTGANAVVRFVEPLRDYQVDATVRITDNNGGFYTNTYRFWVRNKVPTAGVTVVNAQTQQTVGNAFLNNWATTNPTGPATGACSTATPPAALDVVSGPACFQFDAGATTDQDGYRAAQLWRIWKVPASGPRVQVAEFGDQNSGGTTCQVNTAFPGRPVLPAANCFVFNYAFNEYGTYAVVLQAYDNDGGFSSQQEVQIKVNEPPKVDGIFACPVPVSGTPNCAVSTSVQNVDGTQGGFAFNPLNPQPAATNSGGAVQSYRWEWDDGTTNTLSSTTPFTKRYDSTNPGVSTGLNGQWRVKLTVIDASSGTASVTQLVRFNRRPVAGLSSAGSLGLVSGLPAFRLNTCTPVSGNPDQATCTLPAVDGSAPTFSNDPDAQTSTPISEWRWYTPNYSSSNPDTGILTFLNSAQAKSTTSGLFPSALGQFQIGYTDATGPQIFLAVKDQDNAWSTNSAGFRVTANRAPRRLQVDSPTAVTGNATVQRNVPTNFQLSTQDDLWSFAGPTTFTLAFRDGAGNPVTFLDATGAPVTSVTGTAPLLSGAVSGATGSVFSPRVTLTQNTTGLRAVLTATDSEGLSTTVTNTVRYDVVDASPVAIITPAQPATAAGTPNAAGTYVFTSNLATPPAFSFQLDGSTSYDPDGGPGGTVGPVSSYSWTVAPTSAGAATSCSTGEFPNTGSNGTFACTLPQAYGTYRVTLDVWDAPAGTPGRRTGSTTWTVKVNRAPNTPTLTTNTPSVTGLSTPFTFTATASDNAPDAGIYKYVFDFGNGVTQEVISAAGTASATYTYPAFGTYSAAVTVTDSAGATAVSAPRTVVVNNPPVARMAITRVNDPAGSCGTADPCVVNQPPPGRPAPTVSLDASGSTDTEGGIGGYSWTITRVSSPVTPAPAPPTLGPVASGNVTFNGPGLYNVTVQVADQNTPTAGTATISRQVRVNAAPTATLPSSFSCQRNVACAFTGTASDPENDAIGTWSWQLLDSARTPLGPAETTAAGSWSKVVTLPAPGTGSGFVRLTVTDANSGVSDTVEAPLTVANQLPTGRVTTTPAPPLITPTNAGSPQVVNLNGSGSTDPDGGTLTYAWTVKNAGGTTLFTATGPSLDIGPGAATNALGRGTYTVTLVVNDGQGGNSVPLDTVVTINGAPVASAVATPSVVNPDPANPSAPPTVTLNGSGTTDPDNDPIDTYAWTITGPGGFSTTASGAQPPAVTLGGFGIYSITLTATDNKGGIGTATTTVRRNQAPSASATLTPSPQPTPPVAACTLAPATTCVINPGQDLALDGRGTTDPDNEPISSFAWRLLDSSNAVTASASGAQATIPRPANGTYKVELTVTDQGGATSVVTGNVLVNQAPDAAIDGILPTIVVGRSGTAPEDVVEYFFSATASDPEGRGLQRYDWRFLSGATVLATATSSAPTLDPTTLQSFAVLVPNGTVELTVTDVDGAATTVTKSFQVVNRAPVVQLEQNPTDTVGVPGYVVDFTIRSLRDPDGSLTASSFQVCPNPATGTGCATSAPDLANGHTVTFPTFGTFTVTLSATDNDGVTSTDVRTIKINRPPVARIRDAGTPANPIELTSPAGVNFTLDGTAPTYSSDPDGTVQGYSWTITSGATLVDTGSSPTLTRTYAPGTYTVTLQVFDDDGGDDTFTATLRVT